MRVTCKSLQCNAIRNKVFKRQWWRQNQQRPLCKQVACVDWMWRWWKCHCASSWSPQGLIPLVQRVDIWSQSVFLMEGNSVVCFVECNKPNDCGLQSWATTILNGQRVKPNTMYNIAGQIQSQLASIWKAIKKLKLLLPFPHFFFYQCSNPSPCLTVSPWPGHWLQFNINLRAERLNKYVTCGTGRNKVRAWIAFTIENMWFVLPLQDKITHQGWTVYFRGSDKCVLQCSALNITMQKYHVDKEAYSNKITQLIYTTYWKWPTWLHHET